MAPKKGGRIHLWCCFRDCGNTCDVTQDHLIQGPTKSCGCLHDTVGKENLRLVNGTSVAKLEKRRGRISAADTTGYTGVYPQSSRGKRTGRWNAQIDFRGKK